jgi:CRISPR/Cas system-associated exonuclease Cas4 (RecB family)
VFIVKDFDDIKICRINVNVEQSVKDWYQYKAKSMGMSMCQLMAYVIANYCETQRNSEAFRSMSDMTVKTDAESLQRENMETINIFLKGIEQMQRMAESGQLSLVSSAMAKAEAEEDKDNS